VQARLLCSEPRAHGDQGKNLSHPEKQERAAAKQIVYHRLLAIGLAMKGSMRGELLIWQDLRGLGDAKNIDAIDVA
jgi:hypothetical protein